MAAVTIRNSPHETHLALKVRAAQNGRSTEAEMRAILAAAVRPAPTYVAFVHAPEPGTSIVEAFAELRRRFGPVELDIARDPTPAGSTVSFE